MSEGVEDLAGSQNGMPDILEAAEQLAALLDLPAVDVHVTSVQMFGQGASASLDIHLSNAETMRFASIRDMVRPQSLIAEVVACAGAAPQLKQPQAVQVVRLARIIAERAEVATEDELAIEWGLEYLQEAETFDVELDNQTARYAAFELISRRDPWAHAREMGGSFAAATIVLRDVTGDRLVRSQWFLRHVRGLTSKETPVSLAGRMKRVGWQRRGAQGHIKATAPGTGRTLTWAFWIVPADWGQE
jgi:hypothetical protein